MGYTSQRPAPRRDDTAPRSGRIRRSLAPPSGAPKAANGASKLEVISTAPATSLVRVSWVPLPHGAASAPAAPTRRFGLTIGQKLAVAICGLQLGIVTGLGVYFEHEQMQALSHELESKADTYAQLVSAQVRSAVAFDDRETAREVFDAVASDSDLSAAVLFDASGKVLHSLGTPSSVAHSASGGVAQRKVFDLPDRFLAVSPVESREGPRGTLALEFAKTELQQTRSALQRAALWAGGAALLVGSLLALAIAQSFSRRLRAIAVVAEKVAGGDLTQEAVRDPARDELGSLARSFGAMLAQIKRLFSEIQRSAAEEQTRLEGLVQQRTAALNERNLDMRRVMDNVDQGFLTIDRRGVMSGEQSAIVERWLGARPASGLLWDYIDQTCPGMAEKLGICWGEVVDGFLPIELALDQMPRSFSKNGSQHFEIAYKPILNGEGQLERAVVVLSDITPQVERERAEVQQREALRLFSRLNEDRAGVVEFVAEARRLVHQITRDTPSDVRVTKRLIHTLKGNAAVFGVERLSSLCHSIEDTMEDTQENIQSSDRQRLSDGWAEIYAQLRTLMGDSDPNEITIHAQDYRELLDALAARRPLGDIQSLVESWMLESTEVRLRRASRQASSLAERLGKGPVDVKVESNNVRLDPKVWGNVWAEFPHLIRNAVDHGLKAPEADAAGPNKLFLRTYMDTRNFVIEVEDSGAGVNWDRVRELARKRGLPAETHEDLEKALFADGLSTKEQVGETSGRGVGMAAVAAAVHAHGGEIRVLSESQHGTRVRLSWPVSAARARSTPAVAHSSLSITSSNHTPA